MIVIELQMVSISLHYINTFLTLGFTGLIFAFSIVKDIKNELNHFNGIAKIKKSSSHCMEKLTKLIRLHANLKELSLSRFRLEMVGTLVFKENWLFFFL